MKLPVAYYGDPVLRKKGAIIEKITDEIRQLVNDMIETMFAENGMGLAAPQVFQSLALFITCPPTKDEEGHYHHGTNPRVFINPKFSNPSKELIWLDEGCLSIPKVYGELERPVTIEVEAMDVEGNIFKDVLTDWAARIAMHENDHINGVLWIDRLSPKEKKAIEPALREIKKKYHKKK